MPRYTHEIDASLSEIARINSLTRDHVTKMQAQWAVLSEASRLLGRRARDLAEVAKPLRVNITPRASDIALEISRQMSKLDSILADVSRNMTILATESRSRSK